MWVRNILIKEFDFYMANLYYKKKLYQTAMTNKSITVIPTTKTGLYKVQAAIVCMKHGKRRFTMCSCEHILHIKGPTSNLFFW